MAASCAPKDPKEEESKKDSVAIKDLETAAGHHDSQWSDGGHKKGWDDHGHHGGHHGHHGGGHHAGWKVCF